MHYCSHCGAQLAPDAQYCSACGQATNRQPQQQTNPEPGGWVFVLIGFFFPVVGLILYLIWCDTKPQRASRAGIGALIGVCLPILLVIFIVAMLLFFMFLGF